VSRGLFGDPPAPAGVPLAERMRPRTLQEVAGQDASIGPGTVLRRLIDEDRLPSLVLWGPPGVGKTTLARVLATTTGATFASLSAVLDGVKDVRRVIALASSRRAAGGRTLLFVDEIHRFNKAQQDAFLPHVESGLVTLVGATTENPSFHVIAPLMSRCRLVVLEALDESAREQVLDRALDDEERGLGARRISLSEAARAALLSLSAGDARALLNVLEAAAGAVDDGATIDQDVVRAAAGARTLGHDRMGDSHFALASALQKSIRGGDVQAGLYWCARLLEGGEDPLFVARRLAVIASEDVGMAQPFLLPIVMAARDAVHFLGMPEGGYALFQAVVALASAPKSNACAVAWKALREEVAANEPYAVPIHLRPGSSSVGRDLGWGRDYQYAHDHPGALVAQEYLPPELAGRRWYEPGDAGREPDVRRHMEQVEEFRRNAAGDRPD